MEFMVRGKGKIKLSNNDFIFEGGEGKVYGKGDTAYKIYERPELLIPEAKIAELAAISHPRVIKPLDILLDKQGAYIGFTMCWVKRSVSLARLFTNTFRAANGVTDELTLALVEAVKEVMHVVHAAKCLVVDTNEFNFLVDDADFKVPYFIDVNSYQTPSFPATAIMPSIRDPHVTAFSPLTDWFGFAIIACQLFIGIHPYKGAHPDYTRKKLGDKVLAQRMKDNVSIFQHQVKLPPAARDIDLIPTAYRNWFIELFEQGKRSQPPVAAAAVITPTIGVRVIHSNGVFTIRLLKAYNGTIIDHQTVMGREITRTVNEINVNGASVAADVHTGVIITAKSAQPVLFAWKNGIVEFAPFSADTPPLRYQPLKAEAVMVADNTLFVKNRDKLMEIELKEMENRSIFALVKTTWDIMPNSSRLFKGLVYQSVLGRAYLAIPRPGVRSACRQMAVPELDAYRIVDAAHQDGVCLLIGFKQDAYHRIVIKFDAQYERYTIRIEPATEYAAVNFAALDNGVVLAIPEDGALELFYRQVDNDRLDIIRSSDIEASMMLCKDGIAARFYQGNQLFQFSRSSA